MELSEDIIYEDLSQQLTVKRSGKNITNLVLKPPRFLEKATKIERDRVYICTREVFLHCELHPDALVICLGDMIPGPWTKRQYPTLFVLDPIEIMTLFNMVQEIYERYDVWKNALVEIIPSTMSLADMVKLSLPIFMNPLDIVDHNLNVVVQGTNTANHEKFQWEPDTQSKPIAINYLLPHREKIMYFSRRKTPYVIHDNISEHYCINLFHNSTHLGYVTLNGINKEITARDRCLFQFFVSILQAAILYKHEQVSTLFISYKTILQDIMNQRPVSGAQVYAAAAEKRARMGEKTDYLQWICIALSRGDTSKTSSEYICNILEYSYSELHAFAYENGIVAFLCVDIRADYRKFLDDTIEPVIESLDCKAGASMVFSDVFKSPHYYKQAVAACKAGITTGRSETLLYYSDEQLTYMLLHANGDFYLTELMPEGLLQLLESRNEKDSPNYWETLRVLLDNEMNASQTARDLYLHRSSFLNRMKKINDTVRLDTPEERLHLRMCIYLYEILHKNRE